MDYEQPKSAKELAWDAKAEEVNHIIDGLGLGVDENIKETVTAFSVHEFPTSGSCEGHIVEDNKGHGVPYPWIDVYAPEPEDWQENEEKQTEWKAENLRQREKILKLLKDFFTIATLQVRPH